MNENQLPKKVTINPNVMVQEVEDEAVLLHAGTEEYFSLDDVGTTMWKLLSEKSTVEDVVYALLDLFDVDENRVRQDLAMLIDQLDEKKLITRQDD